jgi:hypothetical protein
VPSEANEPGSEHPARSPRIVRCSRQDYSDSLAAGRPGSAAHEGLDSGVVRTVRCPTCRRETPWEQNPHRPFCSDRCRVLDLAAWADERYRIPGDPVPSEPTPPGENGSAGEPSRHGR